MLAMVTSMNAMTWEVTWSRPLLLLHALIGFAAVSICVHVLWFTCKGGGSSAAWRIRARRYVGVAWPAYVLAMISGTLIYPAYGVTVRKAWLEANRPDMVGWFEIKEHWAALGLVLAWAMWRSLRKTDEGQTQISGRTLWRGQALITLFATICALANVVIGIWVVMTRSL